MDEITNFWMNLDGFFYNHLYVASLLQWLQPMLLSWKSEN